MDDHWGFPQFLHLRVLDITASDRGGDPKSTEDIQRAFHNILVSLRSPALENVHLELQFFSSMAPSTQNMDSRDATTGAYRAQYADLHAVLARPTFSSLHRVTVVLCSDHGEGSMSAKPVTLGHLDFLRALFAPWCVRGIVNLASTVRRLGGFVDTIAVDKGEGPHLIDLPDRAYLGTALQFVGLGR